MANKKLDIDGKTWTRYSISVWDDIRKNAEEKKIKHQAMFPTQLIKRLLKVYTYQNDTILDPFLGSGSTIIASNSEGRNSIGFEINPEFIDITKKRLKQSKLFQTKTNTKIHKLPASEIRNKIKKETIDMCITSPPYWNILNQKRTADYKETNPYSNSKLDIGNIEDYEEFIQCLKQVFLDVYTTLKPNKRCVVVVMDIRKKDKFYPFHLDLTKIMKEIGFELDDILIWNRKQEYNNMRPLGFPYVFRINKVHEFVMIYQKPKNE